MSHTKVNDMANINPDDTTEPIESAQSSEVPQGNQDGLGKAHKVSDNKQPDSGYAANLRDITATFKLMAEYVDSCNDQSDETGGLAIVPNFKGFKKFLDAKLEVTT